jgi:hypothetical protein
LNVERQWECPRCGRRALASGDVVNVRCTCAPDVWMKLVEPERPPRPYPTTVGPEPILLDELGDDFLENMPGEPAGLSEGDETAETGDENRQRQLEEDAAPDSVSLLPDEVPPPNQSQFPPAD